MRALREAFRPEFIDRIDECIFFPSLSEIEGMDVEVDKSALILAQSRWEKKEKIEKKVICTVKNRYIFLFSFSVILIVAKDTIQLGV